MHKSLFQTQNADIVDLTPQGVEEIQKFPNNYTVDTKPISSKERDWKIMDISNLWIGIIVSVAVYQVASGLLVAGMTASQALLTIVLGHTLIMGVAIALGHFGTRYGLTFPVLCKMVFGEKGKALPSIIRGILGIFWFGVQTWIGGQAVQVIILTFFHGWKSFGFTGQLISFVIFWLINVYIAASGSKAVKIMEGISAPILIVLSLIVILWGLSTADWSFSTLMSADVLQAKEGTGFWKLFWPALSAMIAFDGGIALSMTDYTRHCVNQKAQVIGQLISAPVMTGYISFVGICGTAGGFLAFGKGIWEPAVLVGYFDNSIVRIVFSIFIIMAVLTTNVAGNLVPPTNIIASYTKGKIPYKWVSVITATLALLSKPWDSLSSAYHLIFDVTQFLGALLGPLTGILVASYLFEHYNKVDLVDVYRTDGGKYQYQKGWNVKATSVLLVFTAIVLISKIVPSLTVIFNNAYVFGVIAAGGSYYLLVELSRKRKESTLNAEKIAEEK